MDALPAFETIPKAFAADGTKNTNFSKTASSENTAMSLPEGFPAIFSTLVNEGGAFLKREDFNGILYLLSSALNYLQCGGLVQYNATLASQISGYPQNARLWWNNGSGWVLIESKVGGNSDEPSASTVDDMNGTDSSKKWRAITQTDYVRLSGNQTVQGVKTFSSSTNFGSGIQVSGSISANGGVAVPSGKKITITDTPNGDTGTDAANVDFVKNYVGGSAQPIDTAMSASSTHAVQNKVITNYINNKTTNVGSTAQKSISSLGCLRVWIGPIGDLPSAREADVFYFALKSN